MKFTCDSCGANYMIADEKVSGRGVKVKCKRCSHTIIVRPESAAVPEASSAQVEASGFDDEATAVAAPRRPEKISSQPENPLADIWNEGDGASFDDDATRPIDLSNNPLLRHEQVRKAAVDVAVQEKRRDQVVLPGDDDDAFPPAGVFGDDDAATAQFEVNPPDIDAPGPPDLDADAPNGFGSDFPAMPEGISMPEENFDGLAFGEDVDGSASEFAKDTAVGSLAGLDEGISDREHSDDDVFQGGKVPDRLDQLAGALEGIGDATQISPPPVYPQSDSPDDDAALQEKPPYVEVERKDAAPVVDGNVRAVPHVDAFSAQLDGAFSDMFRDVATGEESSFLDENARGPTVLIDVTDMSHLRRQTAAMPSDIGGEAPLSDEESMSSEVEWHVAIDDEDVGPLSLAEVQEHIATGRVERETLVWRNGMDDWAAAQDVADILALFSRVPMPSLPPIESAFSVGAPIDDLAARNAHLDPFGAVANNSDPSWQPHGLTDVYQAANLADGAATGIAGSPVGYDEPSVFSPTSAEGDWQPGAASALASLVQKDILRIGLEPSAAGFSSDEGPATNIGASFDGGGFPDDGGGASMPNAPAFGAFGGANAPPMGVEPSMSNPHAMNPYGPPGAGYAPARQGLSTWQIVALIGGVGAVLIITVFVGIFFLWKMVAPPQNQVAVLPPVAASTVPTPGGTAPPAGGPATSPGVDVEKPNADVVAATAPGGQDTAAVDEKPVGDQPGGAAPSNPADGVVEKPNAAVVDDQQKGSVSTSPDREAKPKNEATRDSTPKKGPSSSTKADKPKSSPKPDPKPESKPEPKPEPKRGGKCDPLDPFCDEPEQAATKVRETLSKSDILGVVRANVSAINGCGKQNKVSGATIKLQWTILKSGKPASVTVTSADFVGTPVGTCLTRVVSRWSFPPYRGKQIPPITFPFKMP